MSTWLRVALITGLLLALSACSTTPGVRVARASAVVLPADTVVSVMSDDPQSQWAAERALRAGGWQVAASGGSALILRTYTTLTTEARMDRDPFCDPWSDPWRPYGWGPYSRWGGFYGPCPRYGFGDRWEAYPVRTVTWAVEDGQHNVLWYASARELRPAGPPMVLSDRLVRAMNVWRGTPMP